MELPSKELLSAVYGTKITRCDSIVNKRTNELYFESEKPEHDDYEQFYVNIHQMANDMKKWALSEGFFVLSMMDEFGGIALVNTKLNIAIHNEGAANEFEAVTKACEWIRNQKDK